MIDIKRSDLMCSFGALVGVIALTAFAQCDRPFKQDFGGPSGGDTSQVHATTASGAQVLEAKDENIGFSKPVAAEDSNIEMPASPTEGARIEADLAARLARIEDWALKIHGMEVGARLSLKTDDVDIDVGRVSPKTFFIDWSRSATPATVSDSLRMAFAAFGQVRGWDVGSTTPVESRRSAGKGIAYAISGYIVTVRVAEPSQPSQ